MFQTSNDNTLCNDEVNKNKKKQKKLGHFRSSSLSSLLTFSRQSDSPVLSSLSRKELTVQETTVPNLSHEVLDSVNSNIPEQVIVNVSLIDAKELNIVAEDVTVHGLFCKFKLGSTQHVSKCASNPMHPEWRESFSMSLDTEYLMKISLWDKGRESQHIACGAIDLSTLEKHKAHVIWLKLDDDQGFLHLSLTISNEVVDLLENEDTIEKDISEWISNSCRVIGQLSVKVIEARGLPLTDLSGKISAYCALIVDDVKVQTPKVSAYNTLHWDNARYTFDIYDIMSTLTIKIYNKSLMNNELLGKLQIPLVRISQYDQPHWFALKDKHQRSHAKGQCPRLLLDMSIHWNIVTGSMRLFRPQEFKYTTNKPPKFDLALVHKDLEFIRDTFRCLYEINEEIKQFLEWDDRAKCKYVLIRYLIICYFFRLWMLPLLAIAPFLYNLYRRVKKDAQDEANNYKITVEENNNLKIEYTRQNDKNNNESKQSFSGKLFDLHDLTLTITKGIDYMASISDRLYNLTTFSVPFLSYLSIMLLTMAAIGLYYIPINYIFMALGIYKYGRKRINPNRKPNNDILDFIFHIPDKNTLKDWKELAVPEYGNIEVMNEKVSFTIPIDNLQKDTQIAQLKKKISLTPEEIENKMEICRENSQIKTL